MAAAGTETIGLHGEVEQGLSVLVGLQLDEVLVLAFLAIQLVAAQQQGQIVLQVAAGPLRQPDRPAALGRRVEADFVALGVACRVTCGRGNRPTGGRDGRRPGRGRGRPGDRRGAASRSRGRLRPVASGQVDRLGRAKAVTSLLRAESGPSTYQGPSDTGDLGRARKSCTFSHSCSASRLAISVACQVSFLTNSGSRAVRRMCRYWISCGEATSPAGRRFQLHDHAVVSWRAA